MKVIGGPGAYAMQGGWSIPVEEVAVVMWGSRVTLRSDIGVCFERSRERAIKKPIDQRTAYPLKMMQKAFIRNWALKDRSSDPSTFTHEALDTPAK